MTTGNPPAREIEAASLRAWPALDSSALGGWTLRFSRGLSRRANSVQTGAGSGPGVELDDALRRCEQRYRARALRPVFKIVPWTVPADCDARLAARGYHSEGEVSVQARALSDLAGGAEADDLRIDAAVAPAWIATMTRLYPRLQGWQESFTAIVERIAPPRALATIHEKGIAVAGGMAVADGELLGLFDLATDARLRRRGLGRRLVRGLAAWGAARGARQVYLQVETDNVPALNLYAKLGFEEVYRYWYRARA